MKKTKDSKCHLDFHNDTFLPVTNRVNKLIYIFFQTSLNDDVTFWSSCFHIARRNNVKLVKSNVVKKLNGVNEKFQHFC